MRQAAANLARSTLSHRALSTSTGAASKLPMDRVLEMWRGAKAVCFDVDSTVITSEGIDVLAEHCGAGPAVAEWTLKAMGGSVPFHEALEARLKLIEPSAQDIHDCHVKNPLEFTEGVEELVETLLRRDVHVYLVSGGFRQMIDPLADVLNIGKDRIYANNLYFDADGKYAGFDTEEPTSRAGGKAKVVSMLKEKYGYDPIFMVGDGATDMEARPPADAFIGFGGIAVRDVVRDGADWFAMDMQELIKPLKSE